MSSPKGGVEGAAKPKTGKSSFPRAVSKRLVVEAVHGGSAAPAETTLTVAAGGGTGVLGATLGAGVSGAASGKGVSGATLGAGVSGDSPRARSAALLAAASSLSALTSSAKRALQVSVCFVAFPLHAKQPGVSPNLMILSAVM